MVVVTKNNIKQLTENVDIKIFDEKIRTYIKEDYNCNDDCQLGLKTINIDVNGNFYPCVQFVGDENYIIGNCKEGLDIKKRSILIK